TSLNSATCDPSAAGIFTQMLINQYGCDSIVTETVTLLPSDQTSLASTTCIASQVGVFITALTNQYGCDSIITETITLIPGDTTSFVFNTCDPAQVDNIETVYTGQDGCDSLVIETTTLFPLPVVTVQSAIDYNGFDISCAGDADGSAIANANGTTPFTYLWSTTETDPLITGLSAGAYAVSVTDGNGCTTDDVITLTEPELFMIGFEVSEPDCFDQQLGSITVKVNGGVAPFTYSIDGIVFQSSPDFTGLSEGIYQITSLDANDCSATEIISIDVPLMVQVELGDNQVISLGDSSLLQAIVNLPFDSLSSVMWTGIDSIDCPNCLTQLVAPIITTAYTVSVTSIDGCADRDSITISVTTDQKIYIPNIFSPNGDGINDVLSINIGDGVEEISSFEIFDRWGTLVFGAKDILPNDPTISWDGKMKGETMNPGVFTYVLVASFKDGERIVKNGDVTLIR
ncbi:MAG TPA: gliding motility-associated C-terminal domain-containing protein, partial [Saprospiraceae bacterium]